MLAVVLGLVGVVVSSAGVTLPTAVRVLVVQVIEQFVIDLDDGSSGTESALDVPRYNTFALADIDADDSIDLIALDTDLSEISVYLGLGDGSFGAPDTFEAVDDSDIGMDPIAVVIGDFTAPFAENQGAPDGHLDLALINEFGELAVMIGDGTGAFSTPETLFDFGGFDSSGAVSANFDGDADNTSDLAIADFDRVFFLCNNAGSFEACGTEFVQIGLEETTDIADLAVGDFDGDGMPDVVVTEPERDLAHVVYNNGDGDFEVGDPPVSFGDELRQSEASLAVGKFDTSPPGEADTDDFLVVKNDPFGGPFNGVVASGNIDRSFTTQGFLFPANVSAAAVGRFDEDELDDVVFAIEDAPLMLIVGDGVSFSKNAGATAVADAGGVEGRQLVNAAVLKVGRIDGDRLADIVGLVTSGTEFEIARNLADASPTPGDLTTPTPTPDVQPTASATATLTMTPPPATSTATATDTAAATETQTAVATATDTAVATATATNTLFTATPTETETTPTATATSEDTPTSTLTPDETAFQFGGGCAVNGPGTSDRKGLAVFLVALLFVARQRSVV